MRSPFAAAAHKSPSSAHPQDVDVALEEGALFEREYDRDTIRRLPSAMPIARPALHSMPTPPPRPRPSRLPKPTFDAEATTKRPVPFDVLTALRSNLDSVRLRAAHRAPERALDLSRTVEEPAVDFEEHSHSRRR